MNQKWTLILVVVLLAVGLGGVVISQWSQDNSPTSASTAANPSTSVDNLFNQQNPANGLSLANGGSSLSVGQSAAPVVGSSPAAVAPSGRKQYNSFPGVISPQQLAHKKAVIETTKGVIEFEIYPEATKAASNFIFLAQDSFYNGLTFHRIVPNFVVQGGDPKGDGSGGPGYLFEDEPVTRQYVRGTVAMAKRAEPNTNGSQFFIVLVDNPPLEPKYTIFGQVTRGMDVVAKLQQGDVMQKVTIQAL